MKKIIFAMIIAIGLASCVTYKSLDLNKLATGMTKEQVKDVMGEPERILAINDKEEGHQEVLEYRTAGNEVYALEFWNNYLTGYEFLYDDVTYVAPMAPPVIWPDYGRPIYIIPDRPNRPNRPNRPTPPNRPEISRPNMTKPTPGVGPSSRPAYNSNSGSGNSNQAINRSNLAR